MIQGLIDAVVARLGAELRGELGDGAGQIVAGPVASPPSPPSIVVGAGSFRAKAIGGEGGAGEPRPRPLRERFELASPDRISFPLSRSPLPGSVGAALILDEGTLIERRTPLVAGRDFEVNAAGRAVVLTHPLAAILAERRARAAAAICARAGRIFDVDAQDELASVLYDEVGIPRNGRTRSVTRTALEPLAAGYPIVALVLLYRGDLGGTLLEVDYDFAAIHTSRHLEQELLVDVRAASGGEAAKLASLAAAVLLTFRDELLAAAGVEHLSRASVSATQRLSRLDLRAAEPMPQAEGPDIRLCFDVGGEISFTREVGDGFGVIRRIASPASAAPDPVAVEVGLG